MIPKAAVDAWRIKHDWLAEEQVEQDLLLSRAICAISTHEYLGQELVFRGGTALHKLHLPKAYRYSEDLDYVRTTSSGIKQLTTALKDLGESLGFRVSSELSQQVKVFWKTTSVNDVPIKIKIETNTHERFPHFDLITVPHQIESLWWSGSANVKTFELAELVATKIRALHQRSKGRDLFDLWLALVQLEIPADRILQAFETYKPRNWNVSEVLETFEKKLSSPSFCGDLDLLVRAYPEGYDVQSAGRLIIDSLLVRS